MTEPLPGAVFREYKDGHGQRHADERTAVEKATEAVSREFESHRRAHDEKHLSDQQALKLQRETGDLRFQTITNEYLKKEQFDAFLATEAEKPLSVTQAEFTAFRQEEQTKRRAIYAWLSALAISLILFVLENLVT